MDSVRGLTRPPQCKPLVLFRLLYVCHQTGHHRSRTRQGGRTHLFYMEMRPSARILTSMLDRAKKNMGSVISGHDLAVRKSREPATGIALRHGGR